MIDFVSASAAFPETLNQNTVFCTAFAVDPIFDDLWACFLSSEETANAENFLRPSDKSAYLAAHGLVRFLLRRFLGVLGEIKFVIGNHGKPCLPNSTWSFNLSHSAGWVAVAVGNGLEVGIDVEVGFDRCHERLADFVLHQDERDFLANATCKGAEFLKLWVSKEAVVKAWGTGMGMVFSRLAVESMENEWGRYSQNDGGRKAYVKHITLPSAYLAIAVADTPPSDLFYLPLHEFASNLNSGMSKQNFGRTGGVCYGANVKSN